MVNKQAMHGYSNTRHIGAKGENLAAAWLESNGFSIIKRNYRKRTFELDIIALKNRVLHFVEVKTVKSGQMSDAVFSITNRNVHCYIKGSAYFMAENPEFAEYDCCMDAVIISGNSVKFYENISLDLDI